MISKQLQEYVSQKISEGKTKEEIRSALRTVGWKKADIDEVLVPYGETDRSPLTEVGEQTKKEDKTESKPVTSRKAFWKFLFFDILSFLIGAAVVFTAFLFLNKPDSTQNSGQKPAGFQVQQVSDEKRVMDLLKIQVALEKYYKENKGYPNSLDDLKVDLPATPSGSKYSYIPIGTPAEAYTLNAQIESIESQNMVIEGGFLTLKNMQGQK